jgi:hypothetical protein
MRQDALAARAATDVNVYTESVQLSRDIANILRRNIAQIQKVSGEGDTWSTFNSAHLFITYVVNPVILMQNCE